MTTAPLTHRPVPSERHLTATLDPATPGHDLVRQRMATDLDDGTCEVVSLTSGRSRRSRITVPRYISRLLGVVLVLASWQVASTTGALHPNVIGSPSAVWAALGELLADGTLVSAITTSLRRVALGLSLGLVIGTVLAVVTGLSRIGEDVLDSPLQMLRTVPFAGLIPLLIVWFGVGEAPKIILISLAVVFPIYLNLTAGIRGADQQLIEAASTLGLSRIGTIVHVVLPGALPQLLVGVRVSLGVSWLALVFAEQISAVDGIGYVMATAQQLLHTDVIVVCLLVYAVLGLLADLVVRGLENVLLAWRPRGRS